MSVSCLKHLAISGVKALSWAACVADMAVMVTGQEDGPLSEGYEEGILRIR